MKLKSLNKVCTAICTRYTVRNESGETLDYFTVDYAEKDIPKLNKTILKRFELEKRGAEVQYVDTHFNQVSGKVELHVDCIVKGA